MQRFRSILAVLTEESLDEAAFGRALALARSSGAALTLVDAVDAAPGELSRLLGRLAGRSGGALEEDVLAYHRDRLARFAERAREAGVEVSEAVLQGVPFVEVIRMVLREGHDLVIKGATRAAHGRGRLNGFDLHILRKCPCPVWMLMSADDASYSRVLAAVDPGDEDNATRAELDHSVLELATALASDDQAELHAVHAWRLQAEQALRHGRYTSGREVDVDRMVEEERRVAAARFSALMQEWPQVPRENRHLVKGDPGEIIAAFAEAQNMDAIVMGTVGRTGLSGFFTGNTAETILGAVKCSVLAVKPSGFECPVKLEAG